MAEKNKPIKCSKCGHEFNEEELFDEHMAYVHNSRILCKDCLVTLGDNMETAKTYLEYQNDQRTTKPHDW